MRLLSTQFYIDREFHRAAFNNTESIDTRGQSGEQIPAVAAGRGGDWRARFIFSFEANLSTLGEGDHRFPRRFPGEGQAGLMPLVRERMLL